MNTKIEHLEYLCASCNTRVFKSERRFLLSQDKLGFDKPSSPDKIHLFLDKKAKPMITLVQCNSCQNLLGTIVCENPTTLSSGEKTSGIHFYITSEQLVSRIYDDSKKAD